MILEPETKYADKVENALLANMNVLIDNEYSYYECAAINSEENENSYEFKFYSLKAKRNIDIRYSPATDEMAHYFSIYISNDENKFIFLDAIIKAHELSYNIKNFLLNSYTGDFDNQLQEFTTFLNKLLKENFYDIVIGKKWEDIAFDWEDYK